MKILHQGSLPRGTGVSKWEGSWYAKDLRYLIFSSGLYLVALRRLLGGSWVVISRALSRIAILLTPFKGHG